MWRGIRISWPGPVFILLGALLVGLLSVSSSLVFGLERELFMELRQSAPHFWAQQRDWGEGHPLGPWLNFEGLVLGDAHPGNFSIIAGQRGEGGALEFHFIPYDFDDAGQGPLILDFLRLFSAAQLLGVSAESLLESYLQGLGAYEFALPASVVTLLQTSLQELETLEKRELERFVRGERFDRSRRALEPLSLELYQELASYVPGEILDSGIFHRSHGGSRGMRRYWLLVRDNDKIKFIEFKEMAPPALGLLQPQPPHPERLDKILEAYLKPWPLKPAAAHQDGLEAFTLPLHQVVEIQGQSFWQRQRGVDLLKEGVDFRDRQQARWVSLTGAYLLGLRHGQQAEVGEAYHQALRDHSKEDLLQRLKTASRHHLIEIGDQLRRVEVSRSALVEWRGDVRVRQQTRKEGDADTRTQSKLRARLRAQGQVNRSLRATVGLSTGSKATSVHENMGGGFVGKDFYLDQASLQWSAPGRGELPGLSGWDRVLVMGKMADPHFRVGDSELFWDSAIQPEGAAAWIRGLDQSVHQFTFLVGAFLLEENYRKKRGLNRTDSSLLSSQWVWDMDQGLWQNRLGMGWYQYGGIKGEKADSFGDSEGNGNSLIDDRYVHNYHVGEIQGEISLHLSSGKWSFFCQVLQNVMVKEDNQAYLLGLQWELRPWSLRYAYQRLEADSVLGALSQTGPGPGGTDLKGHEVNVGLRLGRGFALGITQFWVQSPLNEPQNYLKNRIELTGRF